MRSEPAPPDRIQPDGGREADQRFTRTPPAGFGSYGSGPAAAPPAGSTRWAGAWPAGKSATRTALVVLLGLAFIALNTAIAYAAVGSKVISIVTGVAFCLAFMIVVRLLHRAMWLSLLSFIPGLFVLVGSVELAPDLALENRGVRQQVTVVDAEVAGKRHTFTLEGDDGPLDEPLIYRGSAPDYEIGDTLTVLTDPNGVIALKEADRVDSTAKLGSLVLGGSGWTFIALVAGWRGHVRRREGRFDTLVI
ncbi:hypothetical protein [Phytohabitans houttuyneae]|uniref:hypothetical protein n=1 Tax=Phytohabitans houttuyneae TaxID=1076126 RepID=UPI001FE50DE5|nr:hypothetical protein [Phytohabitans houttuyneae]